MEQIVTAGTALIEVFLCIWFAYGTVCKDENRVDRKREWAAVAVAVTDVLLVVWRRQTAYFDMLTSVMEISLIAVALLLLSDSRRRILCETSIFVFWILNMADYIIGFLIVTYRHTDIMNIYRVNEIHVAFLILKLVFLILVGMRKMEFQIHDLKSNRNVFRTLIIVETIVVCYFQWQLKNRSSERIVSNGVILLFLGGCILAAGVAAVVLFNERDYMNYIKVRNDQLERNYESIYQNQKEVSRISHDFKNHMNLIVNYLENKEVEKALQYCYQIREPLRMQEEKVWSGDKVVDIVLTDKLQLAKRKRIAVVTEIQRMGKLGMTDYDICVIFANLLDNAIEACSKLEEEKRKIWIGLKKQGPVLVLKIENCVTEKYDTIRSTKHDGRPHGIGMESVKKAVVKYQGRMQMRWEEETFQVTITLLV